MPTVEAYLKFAVALLAALSWTMLAADCASAITISIDYSYDTAGFFNTQAKKDLLQDAADTLANQLTDHLSAITPGGGNTWNETFFSPATGATVSVPNPTIPADTIVVYAGGRDLGSQTLGQGGNGAYTGASGDSSFFNVLNTRGQSGAPATDFGPWGGSITFTTNAQAAWSFSNQAPTGNTYDFFSVAIHELAHVLGYGLAPSWDNLVSGSAFMGVHATAANGGVHPALSSGGDHWLAGTMSDGRYAAMGSSLYYNTRTGFTSLDYAGLADIGWSLAPAGIAGDVNHDGIVDIQDITAVANTWLTPNPAGDTNGDSIVNIQDVTNIANHWLQTSGGGGNVMVVPEPATIGALAIGALILAAAAKRKSPNRRQS